MKNDNTILWIIGIVIVVFLILPKLQIQEQEEFATVKVHYYDKDMNEIFPLISIGTFSIIPQTSGTNPTIETIDPSLLDDAAGFAIKEDIVHNFENGLPDVPGEDIEDVPNTKTNFLKNLISQIGTFGIITTTKTITIYASNTDTYCEKRDATPSYNFDPDSLNDIGSDEISAGYEVCNGLMQFPVTGLPADLTSASQITSITLNYKVDDIWSDEGNGASTDFGLVDDLEDYDWTPNDETEEGIMFEMLETMSNTGIEIFTYNFLETQYNFWFSNQIGTTAVKNEIIANKDGSPDNVLAIGIEGESDPSDDERLDFYDEGSVNKPYIIIKYTVTTCQPETCASLGKQCGTWSDTCGGTLNCGTCGTGYICDVNGQCIEDIVYISFEVTATNSITSEIDYTGISITNATPIELKNALPVTSYDLPIGLSQTWYSDNITVKSEWKGTTQTFGVWVSGTNEYTELIETKYASTDLIL